MVKKYCKKQPKIIEYLHHQKLLFFLCMYKTVDTSAETWNKTGVAVVKVHENDGVNKKISIITCIFDIGKRWGSTNIYDL